MARLTTRKKFFSFVIRLGSDPLPGPLEVGGAAREEARGSEEEEQEEEEKEEEEEGE